MPRMLIVTDSTCDLPREWITRFDIRVVPTYVQFGTESLADDGVQLTRTQFYDRLVSAPILPTTAAPPPGKTLEAVAQALKEADHVIAITAPAKLSGIYNTFRLAAEETDPSRITLIDSEMVSMGLGWQVIIAAEMIQAGASPDEIKTRVTGLQPYAEVWAALETMEYLRRSGRVGWAAGMVGELFRIKPIIRLHQSVVSSVGRVRTSARSFESLIEIAHQNAPFERLAILHTNRLDGARKLLDALSDIRPAAEVTIVDVTPVIGVHVGPNALGLGVVREK